MIRKEINDILQTILPINHIGEATLNISLFLLFSRTSELIIWNAYTRTWTDNREYSETDHKVV
jgi:hypothetical protein